MMRPLLTLVTNFGAPTGAAAPTRQIGHASQGEQLNFAFLGSEPDIKIMMIPMDDIHGLTLCENLMSLQPKVIIDLRHLVRFDLPGANRSRIFHCINSLKAFYISESVPWHELSMRDFSTSDSIISQLLFHEVIERETRSVAIMVPKKNHCQMLSSHLNRLFSSRKIKRWTIQLAC